jgi:predicted RNase H-like HicB family nuclease
MSEFYVAVLETNSEGEVFATIPDLPGVNSAAATKTEALSLAIEFANDYVRDLAGEGHPVPKARDLDEIEHDPEVKEIGRALIPVEVPGKSVKISISIDEAQLARVDRAAEKIGMTRSGYFAVAAEEKIRQSRGSGSGEMTGVYGGVPVSPMHGGEMAMAEKIDATFYVPGGMVPISAVVEGKTQKSAHITPKGGGAWQLVWIGRGGTVVQEPPPDGRKRRRGRSEHKGN